MQIAIDGPAGAGKSTIAKKIAHDLGFVYIDSGALYRAVTLLALRQDQPPEEGPGLEVFLDKLTLDLTTNQAGRQQVWANGQDLTEAIRDNAVSQKVSAYSALPSVRQLVTDRIQHLAAQADVVMDGRDIGTVVLPAADLKIFLTASVEERARRRVNQLASQGDQVSFETIAQEIADRDEKDRQRAVAPLVQAADAVYLDSSHMGIEEVSEYILGLIRK